VSYIIIAIVSLLASMLTFYSGFGLGTLLTPVFMLWVPVDIAVAMTAIVHLLNNLFKWGLTHKHIDWPIAIRFGIPAIVATIAGAYVLGQLNSIGMAYRIQSFGLIKEVSWLKVVMAGLIIAFVLIELVPSFRKMTFERRWLPMGGILSGFFGGLAGFQGALRSMFLVKSGLPKEAYIATGIIIACMIDVIRLSIYGYDLRANYDHMNMFMVGIATIFAFLGAYMGNRWLSKVTMDSVQWIVSILLTLIAISILMGYL
jgi:uncharacterized protein